MFRGYSEYPIFEVLGVGAALSEENFDGEEGSSCGGLEGQDPRTRKAGKPQWPW